MYMKKKRTFTLVIMFIFCIFSLYTIIHTDLGILPIKIEIINRLVEQSFYKRIFIINILLLSIYLQRGVFK